MNTRLFATTTLSAALPAWVLDGERTVVAERLKDPALHRRLASQRNIVTALAAGDWNREVLFECVSRPELSRQSIAEISAATGMDPLEAICDILLAEIDSPHQPMLIAPCHREEEIRPAFEHPCCAVGSDATTLASDGPLRGSSFHGAYTWAAWFIRHFVQDTEILTPQEAVRRLTSLPAERLGLSSRGIIRLGAWANLAVFDPQHFAERGTIFEPNRYATGIVHVLVNGVPDLKDGAVTNQRCGPALRRV